MYYRLSHDIYSCSLGNPLSYSSPVVVFYDRGHPRFRNFYSTVPVDVVRLKSYVNNLFDPANVPVWITINELNLIPKQLMSGVVGVLLKRRPLTMAQFSSAIFVSGFMLLSFHTQATKSLLNLHVIDYAPDYKLIALAASDYILWMQFSSSLFTRGNHYTRNTPEF